jgi:hypothetical protein
MAFGQVMMASQRIQRFGGQAVVLDDAGAHNARSALGLIVSRARFVDLAVDGIRLAAFDFQPADLAVLEHCRVVIGGFDNHSLANAVENASGVPAHARHLGVLQGLLKSGRVELRSGGARHWSPDLCVARGSALARWFEDGAVALVGYLGLGAEHPFAGPRLTCVVAGAGPVSVVTDAFARLWSGSHDILDVVADALDRFRDQR